MNINDIKDLINKNDYEMVIVTGYDGVGKGKVLSELTPEGTTPYRPDYNFWQPLLKQPDRWKIFMAFLEGYKNFRSIIKLDKPMIFDRSGLCGAVYNDDAEIAKLYNEKMKDIKALHILVVCEFNDYMEFYKRRNNLETLTEEQSAQVIIDYNKCVQYTERYRKYLGMSELEYIEYKNEVDKSIQSDTCSSCGHFEYPTRCNNPLCSPITNPGNKRCEHSLDKETQDKE